MAPITPSDLGSAADLIRPDFHQVNLDIETYLKQKRGMVLDFDDQICRMNLQPLGCPLGAKNCPLRHTDPSPNNFKPLPPLPSHPREREKKTTVCKHYLRNLCKMGDDCDYSHDANLRTMPDCHRWVEYGRCDLGCECLYFHPKPEERRVECPDFNRGFCVLGPKCHRRHVRRVVCEAYMAGFCPDGANCKNGHPSPHLPKPEEYVNPPVPDPATSGPLPAVPYNYGRWREYQYDPDAVVVPGVAIAQGGSLQGWRAGGHPSANARGSSSTGGRGNESGSRGRRDRDMSTVRCYCCQKYGHIASHCPTPEGHDGYGGRGGRGRRRRGSGGTQRGGA